MMTLTWEDCDRKVPCSTWGGDFFNIDARFQWNGAQDAECGHSGDDGRPEVEEGNDEGVDVDPIPEIVVRAEQDQSSPRYAQGIKHLLGSFAPYLLVFHYHPFSKSFKWIWDATRFSNNPTEMMNDKFRMDLQIEEVFPGGYEKVGDADPSTI